MIKQDGNSIRYPGGKNACGVWEWLLGLMPTHLYYAEPFVGSGALFRRKPPAMRSHLVDIDEGVLGWWRQQTLPGAQIESGCGIEWVRKMEQVLSREWLVYLDPPYLHSTRTKQAIYANELTDEDHGRLLEAVSTSRANVMLSGYASELYDRVLRDWRRFEHEAMTRGGPRTEVVWCNFDPAEFPAAALATPGEDFRERERIKRKVGRWAANYRILPRHERRALLAELIRTEQTVDHRRGRRGDPTAAAIDAAGEG